MVYTSFKQLPIVSTLFEKYVTQSAIRKLG